jgi:hypothetical protein
MRQISSSLLVGTLIWIGLITSSSLYPAQIYQSGAERVRRVLEELSANSQGEQPPLTTYQLSQAEINAYLLDELRHRENSAVASVSILLREGGFVTMIEIDPDQLQLGENTATGELLKLLFNGKQTLEIEGRLSVTNGSGRYQIQQVRFSGVALPIELANKILTSLGQSQDPPFDPLSTFPMPHGIRSVIVSPGQIVIAT